MTAAMRPAITIVLVLVAAVVFVLVAWVAGPPAGEPATPSDAASPSASPAAIASGTATTVPTSPSIEPSPTEQPVADSRPDRPILLPVLIVERQPLPFCGHDSIERLAIGDVRDREPWECLLAAGRAGAGGEVISDAFTVEGGSVREIVRLTPDGTIESWVDTTQDHLGNQGWVRLSCGTFADATIHAAEPWLGWLDRCVRRDVLIAADDPSAPTGAEMALLERLALFARDPEVSSVDEIPTSSAGVWLGLGDRLIVRRTAEDLGDPAGWSLDVNAFRARVGPFSALAPLADWTAGMGNEPVTEAAVTVGSHPHCGSPPLAAPLAVAGLRRVSIQPAGVDTCLLWWSVDAYFDADGELAAVTLDYWEP
jgi:hypothetical protein